MKTLLTRKPIKLRSMISNFLAKEKFVSSCQSGPCQHSFYRVSGLRHDLDFSELAFYIFIYFLARSRHGFRDGMRILARLKGITNWSTISFCKSLIELFYKIRIYFLILNSKRRLIFPLWKMELAVTYCRNMHYLTLVIFNTHIRHYLLSRP